jgi:hypothetical protein
MEHPSTDVWCGEPSPETTSVGLFRMPASCLSGWWFKPWRAAQQRSTVQVGCSSSGRRLVDLIAVINNGSAGLANFRDTTYGVITRLSG